MKIFTTQERMVVIILASLFMLGMVVKAMKEHYSTGKDQMTLISSNVELVNFYTELDKDDIESVGKGNINSAGIDKLISFPGIGKRLLK